MKVIKTGIWEVRVRTTYNFDLLVRKYFFSTVKKDEFIKQIEEHVKGIEVIEDWRQCEDAITYNE